MKTKRLDLSNAVLVQGGGWKKLENQKITNISFKSKLNSNLNIKNIHNYYGMVEQTGSIFFECEKGYFHTSFFSDIIIRDKFFKKKKSKKKGLIKIISIIQKSYNGNSIIIKEQEAWFEEDNSKWGR